METSSNTTQFLIILTALSIYKKQEIAAISRNSISISYKRRVYKSRPSRAIPCVPTRNKQLSTLSFLYFSFAQPDSFEQSLCIVLLLVKDRFVCLGKCNQICLNLGDPPGGVWALNWGFSRQGSRMYGELDLIG